MHACGPILEFYNITHTTPPHATNYTLSVCFKTDQTAPQFFLHICPECLILERKVVLVYPTH